jgi:hypothetical protein
MRVEEPFSNPKICHELCGPISGTFSTVIDYESGRRGNPLEASISVAGKIATLDMMVCQSEIKQETHSFPAHASFKNWTASFRTNAIVAPLVAKSSTIFRLRPTLLCRTRALKQLLTGTGGNGSPKVSSFGHSSSSRKGLKRERTGNLSRRT